MSAGNENIEFEIGLTSKASEDLVVGQAIIDQANELIESLRKKIEEIQEKTSKDSETKKEEKETKKEDAKKEDEKPNTEAEEFLNSLDTTQLSNLKSLATSPEGLIANQFLKFLGGIGPQGAAIVGIITAAVSAPAVIIEIVKVLSQPGGPLNRDWRLFIEKQVDIGLSRAEEKRKALGLDQQIFRQGGRGYTKGNEAWISNNFIKLPENRLSRVGLSDREDGLLP